MSALDDDYEAFPPHTRIPNDELLEVYAELTNNGEYDLLPYEEEWKQRGPLLDFYGYKLRQRYELDWQPSWVDTNLNPFFCEDSIDSSVLAIKATLGWTREASIAFLFTDGDAIEEPRNHCVPILDTFIEEDIVYLVMPLLRAFNDPPFVTVAEVIDFVDQMVQGIEYMHEQNVAHRDITIGNIMMDASELYPDGFHPVRQNLARDGLAEVVGVMRTHAPVRYYLIDFDAAIAFEKGTPTKLKYAEGKAGRDDEVPEFRIKAPYDPFKVDIFQFGNLLRKEFLQKYSGIEFLEPLVKEMTRPHAVERPSASKLRLKFNTIRNRLTSSQMRTHLELKDITDPLRERLLALGIESLLDSETDDSPEQSSSEAPTTGNSNRSHDSYWSVDPSLDSSMTSQSSVEQAEQEQEQSSHGPFHMITSALSRARSPGRATSKGPDSKPSVWKPAKMADRQRSPSPTPISPESMSRSSDDTRPSARSTSPKPKGPYLRTGKFPWSRSSSPDSAGSPILAVVNQFLSPEASGLYGGDGFDYELDRPYETQKGWSQNTYAATYANYGPSKNELPPQPAAPPVTASQNNNAVGANAAQQSVPGRNRRNTVSTAKPLASFETIAPSSFMSPPQGAAASAAERGGWGTINSIYEEPEANSAQPFYGEQGAKSTIYSKYNKSVNALPLSLNQSQWEPPAPPQKETIPFDQFNNSPVDFWGTDAMVKSMTQAPSKPTATRPVERKESLVDKFVKPTKPSTPIPSKKNAPSQVASSSPPKPTIPPTRPSLATIAGNRKSTI
ncbi:16589_t:CDS:2, partial [Acaulospora colombiana]